MVECPVCRQAFLYPDEGAVACHMILNHDTKSIYDHLQPFGTEWVEGYLFSWCGHLINVEYPWKTASDLEDAAEELAGHWTTRGGVQAHYLAHCLGVDDAPGTDAV